MDTQNHFDSARFVFEEAPRAEGSDKVRFINVDEEESEEESESLRQPSRRAEETANRPSTWPMGRHAIVFLLSLLLLNTALLLPPLPQGFQIYIYKKIPFLNNTLRASMDAVQPEYTATGPSPTITESSIVEVPPSSPEPAPASSTVISFMSLLENRVDMMLDDAIADLNSRIAKLVDLELDRRLRLSDTPLPRDFALQADGGAVFCTLTSFCSYWRSVSMQSPQAAIDDNTRIGHCWKFPSHAAQLGIVLQAPIYPSSVTIDHIPRVQAADIGSAPRRMVLWGVVDGALNLRRFHGLDLSSLSIPAEHNGPQRRPSQFTFAPLSTLEYDIDAEASVQNFPISTLYKEAAIDFAVVVLEILDNWGSDSTCLYRVRIHGEEAFDLGGLNDPVL